MVQAGRGFAFWTVRCRHFCFLGSGNLELTIGYGSHYFYRRFPMRMPNIDSNAAQCQRQPQICPDMLIVSDPHRDTFCFEPASQEICIQRADMPGYCREQILAYVLRTKETGSDICIGTRILYAFLAFTATLPAPPWSRSPHPGRICGCLRRGCSHSSCR